MPGSNRQVGDAHDNSLASVLQALANASTWEAILAILNRHADLLLSEEALAILDAWISESMAIHDGEYAALLIELRALLERCCLEGIDVALADRVEQADVQSLVDELQSLTRPGDMMRRAEICSELLALVPREAGPEAWALLQGELGKSLQQSPLGDRAANLENAIIAFGKALEVYTCQDFPEQWAATQNNLGAAHRNRIRGDRAANLERALAAYEQALTINVRESHSASWALTSTNLGTVYFDRIYGDRADNLERAIAAYERALTVRTLEDLPVDWALTQNNLGAAYSHRVKGVPADNLERAIAAYEQALTVRTREAYPEQWAATQNNLGTAYFDRTSGDRADNLERAVAAYEQALTVRTPGSFPLEWAMTQSNLANAHYRRIHGDRAESRKRALIAFDLALTVRTPETLPQDCRDTALDLGKLLYLEHRPSDARPSLVLGHLAIEAMRGEPLSAHSRSRVATENAELYAMLVTCCLDANDTDAAFAYAAAAKGRAFVDQLTTARIDFEALAHADSALASDLIPWRVVNDEIASRQAQLVAQQRGAEQPPASLAALREREAALWDTLHTRHPALAATLSAPALTIGDAQALSRALGATLVEYYRHAEGWCAFVVTPGTVRHVPLPDLAAQLPAMRRWVAAVAAPQGRGALSFPSLRRWYAAAFAPVAALLPACRPAILAPFGPLHQLPLHIALNPATGAYAADEFPLAFAPSLGALSVVAAEARRKGVARPRGILAAAYPGADPDAADYLSSAVVEAEAAAAQFPGEATALYREAATAAAVLDEAPGHRLVHLGSHARFDAGAPEESGLLLADGALTLRDIVGHWRLRGVELVTLAACGTALATIDAGDQAAGLLQAVLTAGARCVLASLWPVDDASTARLFEAFYRALATGSPPAAALHGAQATLRADPRTAHPFHWAAFQTNGLAHVIRTE